MYNYHIIFNRMLYFNSGSYRGVMFYMYIYFRFPKVSTFNWKKRYFHDMKFTTRSHVRTNHETTEMCDRPSLIQQ